MTPKPPDSPAQVLKKAIREARDTHWESALLFQFKAENFHVPQRQWKFHHSRKWAFDFAWPEVSLAVEVDGGTRGVACGSCRGTGRIWFKSRTISGPLFCRSCSGGGKVPGRHTSGEGFEADLEKMNEAQAMGWRVFRFTRDMIKRGEAVGFIQKNFMRRT